MLGHLPSDASAGMRNCNTKIRQRQAHVVHVNTHPALTVCGDLVLVWKRGLEWRVIFKKICWLELFGPGSEVFAEPGPSALLRCSTARYAISVPCAAAAALLFRRAPVRIDVCALIGQPSDQSNNRPTGKGKIEENNLFLTSFMISCVHLIMKI